MGRERNKLFRTNKQTNTSKATIEYIRIDAICHSFARFVQHFAIIHFAHFQPHTHRERERKRGYCNIDSWPACDIEYVVRTITVRCTRCSDVWSLALSGQFDHHTVIAMKNCMFNFKDVCHLVWYYRWYEEFVRAGVWEWEETIHIQMSCNPIELCWMYQYHAVFHLR